MISKRFRDFDAFATLVRDVDCVMLLNNLRQRLWVIKQVNVAGIDVQFGQVGSGNIIEGQSWPNGILLYLPLTDTCEYRANGNVIPRNAAALLEPGCEFYISTGVAHDWCSIFIPTDMFTPGGNLVNSSIALSVSEKARCRISCPSPQVASRFLSAVREITTAAASSLRFETSPAAESAAEELMKVATSYATRGYLDFTSKEGRPRISREEIIRSCQHLLEERADDTVRVGDMAAAAGVSDRMLRTAFYEYFGVGPLRYLELRQLNQVHRALQAANPAMVSVSDVLVDHGVWEFGRIASRYRHLFGELPSETLRKTG